MKDMVEIKRKLFYLCQQNIEGKINVIEERLKAIKDSRDNETKSSVGDKYETGRAMMHLEEENMRVQLSLANKIRQELLKINIERKFDSIEPGSLVSTSNGDYFISVGIGPLSLDSKIFYCISIKSPMGNELRNKSVGDEFEFNGKRISVEEIN